MLGAQAMSRLRRAASMLKGKKAGTQHQLSTRIVRENQVICVESLAVKNMIKNHCLAKSISDVGWGELVRQLEYKCAWYGRTLVKIDRWYPSSKTCHVCKQVLEDLDLEVRTWVCPVCGTLHDRDVNAACNNLAEGLSVAACGGSVRPVRANARRATPSEAGTSLREDEKPLPF